MNYGEIVRKCFSISQFCKELNISTNGSGYKIANKIIKDNELDVSHFNRGVKHRVELLECPICGIEFESNKWGVKKVTCSYKCSNSFFRSGKDNPNWKDSSYRSTCFLYHKKECVICGESKIVEVHHMDGNKDNNSPDNLIPLCPTHHQYWHSRYKKEVEDKIYNYMNNFKSLQQIQQQINSTG